MFVRCAAPCSLTHAHLHEWICFAVGAVRTRVPGRRGVWSVWERQARSVRCFFFNDTAPPEIYPLSLHDALPIYPADLLRPLGPPHRNQLRGVGAKFLDRKSTRLNSSHLGISYAVFCLKKKK